MKQHDQQCTSRADDWRDLWAAIKAFPKGRVGHELENIVREEWRRLTGKCPKKPPSIDQFKSKVYDEHEP